jgi:hypothetical protein
MPVINSTILRLRCMALLRRSRVSDDLCPVWIWSPRSVVVAVMLRSRMRCGDVMIMDRGYPARWLLSFGIEHFHEHITARIQQEIATVFMWVAITSAIHAAVQAGLTDGKQANRTLQREIARICLARALDDGTVAKSDAMITQARRHTYKPRPGRSFPRESKPPCGRTRGPG